MQKTKLSVLHGSCEIESGGLLTMRRERVAMMRFCSG